MKKQIAKQLSVFVITVLILLLALNSFLQYNEVVLAEEETAISTIGQIEDILITNDINIETLTESLQEEYVIKVQTTAYILDNIEITTPEEYQELADMLSVDEIHVFNEDGVIYEGSVESYFGYSFDSGEQMSFFLPLLEDKTLTLCQDITPNTAEDKDMMYIATWNTNGSDIVQIGIEPSRILEEQSQNELSYIFSNMPTSDNTDLFAIDADTGTIVGATEDIFLNLNSSDIGLSIDSSNSTGERFYADINDVNCLCVFLQYDNTYIGYILDMSIVYDDVVHGMLAISGYFTLAALFLYWALLKIINVTILRDIDLLIDNVSKIAGGDLDTEVYIKTSPEFERLSAHLNMMVSSLLNTTAKMSHVLDQVDTNIAVYEYKTDMKRVFATRKVLDLLQIQEEELTLLLSDKKLFEEKILSIKESKTTDENIYKLNDNVFLKIETLSEQDSEYGVITDVSEIMSEKKTLRHERDYDILTDLYNRRAFYRRSEEVFCDPDRLKESVIIALDMDNLKEINDTYGHDGGDMAIKSAANIMKELPAPHKIVCRLGGDEFALIIYGETKKSNLIEHIHWLEEKYANTTIHFDSYAVPIKMSAGYAFTSDFNTSYKTLLKYSDEALYIAKQNGKNRFIHYTS